MLRDFLRRYNIVGGIQGFPTGYTQFCMVGDEVVEMPTNKRRFMLGNALVVNLIKQMEKQLSSIISKE